MSVVQRIVSSANNYDEIAILITQLENTPDAQPTAIHGLISSLTQVFGQLAKDGTLAEPEKATTEQKTVTQWLKNQLNDYAALLLILVGSENEIVAETAFEAGMKKVLIDWRYRRDYEEEFISKLLVASLLAPTDVWISWSSYLEFYDVRYWLLRAVPSAIDKSAAANPAKQATRLLGLFEALEPIPALDEELNVYLAGIPALTKFVAKRVGNPTRVQSQKQAYQKAWLASMELPISGTILKRHLSSLHANVIPNMSKPQLLMDFLTDSYNHGGSIALLALNGLFSLMQKYNLDYPQFFTKLYSLLADGSLLVSSHRSRFLRLLDLFLSSSHLPATVPASIIKRLARLALFAPPGAIVAVIPFIYNQLKRNPTCMLMIHRVTEVQGPESDPFVFEQTDPLLTGAIDSSLWEIQAFVTHYHPNVAMLAKIMSQPFRKPSYQLEHFLAHSYETLYNTERNRKGNGIPALEFEEVRVFENRLDADAGAMSAWSI